MKQIPPDIKAQMADACALIESVADSGAHELVVVLNELSTAAAHAAGIRPEQFAEAQQRFVAPDPETQLMLRLNRASRVFRNAFGDWDVPYAWSAAYLLEHLVDAKYFGEFSFAECQRQGHECAA